MQTYTFHELSTDAQERAIGLYYTNAEVVAYCDERDKENDNMDDPCLAENALDGLGWRFTEHGERIA